MLLSTAIVSEGVGRSAAAGRQSVREYVWSATGCSNRTTRRPDAEQYVDDQRYW